MVEPLLLKRSAWQDHVDTGSYGKAGDGAGLLVRLLDHGFAASVLCPADEAATASLVLGQCHSREGLRILPVAPGQFFIESATMPSIRPCNFRLSNLRAPESPTTTALRAHISRIG